MLYFTYTQHIPTHSSKKKEGGDISFLQMKGGDLFYIFVFMMKSFRVPIYGFMCRVICTDSIAKALKRYHIEEDSIAPSTSAAVYCMTHNQTGGVDFILFVNGKLSFGDMAHECAHLAGAVLSYIEDKPSYEEDEPFCYLLGWFVDKIYPILKAENLM